MCSPPKKILDPELKLFEGGPGMVIISINISIRIDISDLKLGNLPPKPDIKEGT